MKKIILATVLTLVMLSPALAVDVHFQTDSLLVASKEDKREPRDKDDRKETPPLLIIKGKGGKVTGVEKDPRDDRRRK